MVEVICHQNVWEGGHHGGQVVMSSWTLSMCFNSVSEPVRIMIVRTSGVVGGHGGHLVVHILNLEVKTNIEHCFMSHFLAICNLQCNVEEEETKCTFFSLHIFSKCIYCNIAYRYSVVCCIPH